MWEFMRDSTPERLRARFGDADYDWDYRVNTTSGAVAWRDRLLGMFHSAYQPSDPSDFGEMMDAVQRCPGFCFQDTTFIDLGSGKGRTLLMASDYPFRRIVGVELLPSLHEIAKANLDQYRNASQKCFALEACCADATSFQFPNEPLLLYLFNPLPEPGLRRVVHNLEESLRSNRRSVFILYYNPLLDYVLSETQELSKIASASRYSLWRSR